MKYSNELDKVSYSLGLSIASNLISSGVKPSMPKHSMML